MTIFISIVGALIALYVFAVILKFVSAIIRGHFSGLKALDKIIFEELRKNLSSPAQKIMDEQLTKPLQGRRYHFDKSYHLELYINTYDSNRPLKPAFPMRDGSNVASAIFECRGIKYKISIETYAGAIEGIKIKPSVKKIIDKSDINFTRFTILNDPMIESNLDVVEAEYYKSNEELPELLKSLQAQYKIKNIRKPLPQELRAIRLNKYNTPFPDDYLQLVEVTEGFEIGDDFTVNGLAQLETVFNHNADYWKMIETQDGVVCLKKSRHHSNLVCFYFEGENKIDDLGNSFVKALEIVYKDQDKNDTVTLTPHPATLHTNPKNSSPSPH